MYMFFSSFFSSRICREVISLDGTTRFHPEKSGFFRSTVWKELSSSSDSGLSQWYLPQSAGNFYFWTFPKLHYVCSLLLWIWVNSRMHFYTEMEDLSCLQVFWMAIKSLSIHFSWYFNCSVLEFISVSSATGMKKPFISSMLLKYYKDENSSARKACWWAECLEDQKVQPSLSLRLQWRN